jgi:hypothetical protein
MVLVVLCYAVLASIEIYVRIIHMRFMISFHSVYRLEKMVIALIAI